MTNLKTTELRQIAQELGLIENTGTRHKNNGTLSFLDPVASTTTLTVSYSVHSNGYVRRNFRVSRNLKLNALGCYQLNRTRKVEKISQYSGNTYIKTIKTERIMATPLEQVAILFLSTINYRKNKNK